MRRTLAILACATALLPARAALPPELTRLIETAPGPEALPGADAVYLRHERDIEVDAAGRREVVLRQTIKILRAGGRHFERIELPWVGTHQLPELRAARTVLTDGREIDVRTVALEQVLPGYYGERLGAVNRWRLNFPYVEPGAIVDWELAITDQRPSLPDGLADQFQMQLGEPVAHTAYRVRVPSGTLLRQSVQGELPPPTVRRVGTMDETVWQADGVPALPSEPDRPADDRIALSILVSTVDSWSQVAERYRELALPMYAPDGELRGVAAAAKVQPDPALALYRAVTTRVRYGFGSFERGVAGLQPLPAYQTWRRRQGDCKDQATLLLTLLQEAGIEAWPALVRRKVRGPLVERLPAMIQFDHVVVAVPDGPAWRFFDPSFSFGPADYLPADVQGVTALVLRDGSEEWATLPSFGADINRFERRAELDLDEDGGLSGRVTIAAGGGFEQSLRERFAGATMEQAERDVAAGLNAALGGVRYAPGSLHWTASEAMDQPFSMVYRFAAAAYALRTRQLLLIRPAVFQQADMPAGLSIEQRTLPIELAVAPERTYNEIVFRIPAGLVVRELPDDRAATSPCGTFAVRFRQTGEQVVYTREVVIQRPEIAVDQLAATRAWYDALLEADRALLVLERREQG